MAKLEYPLEEILSIKRRRVDEALEELHRKELALQQEKEVLAQREAERDKVLNHRNEKLQQLRDTLDHEMSTTKVQQMKAYLKIVKEKLIVEEKKVSDQREQVEIAKTNVEIAKEEVRKARKEVDKLEKHKEEWLKRAKKELAIEEERQMDEMGSIMFMSQMRQRK